ncbi:cation acetate symporter [Corynebacterium sp. 153RC1]|uniref:solute symporter family protein n=1 Tax=unclassified Corynebacterium TaxID=2624378 RepID=UPI00211BA086|nr:MULTISPECIES: cation acetate symporter [unclassified Corynebacterium]MCQ9353353.1 cation acetate symporter [Corynebacterium sp. 209RC1]MCQ9355524.1 cation acetate symporter [Corynebacterium sp. 1222RC1]MCQ9357661.1 cation acetate symporter [Corynebacterium sp. 122RC1]MCQ9359868.1 cation acetate symporter [Corynebacterium sp. 142RC1]MCQ9361997.1 cation acetate symporter [Corynebacterium sp. 153RC1]
MQNVILAQESSAGNPVLNMIVFGVFIVATMAVVMRAGKTTKEASDFYTGGASFTGRQNGLAIAGDYLSAASFLGIVGAIALNGYDGFLYSIGFFVAWLVALLLVAEPLRNVGRFTMADVLSFRLKQKPVRVAAAFGTLFVSLFYLIAQMAGAGSLVSVLLDLHDRTAQSIVVAIVGVIMILYVLIGGMKGTTYVQMIKAVLLVGGVTIMTLLVFVMVRGGLSDLFDQAVEMHANSEYLAQKGYEATQILEPGLQYGASATSKLDFISLGISLVLGTAGLPHVLMRFYTVPTATEARRSVTWAIVLIGAFYLMTLVLGFGAAALVGPDRIMAAPGTANAAAPLLALALAGPVFMAAISAVAFATVLAVVAGLAITASASVAHDIYDAVIRDGQASEEEQVRVSRITVIVIGALSIILGILAMEQNVAFLVSLAFAIAASANLPTILYSLYWKRFNTAGAVASMYAGLGAALILIIFSPAVSGTPTSMLPNVDFAFFPLKSPGIVSIPLAFLAGAVFTFLGKPDNLDDLQAEMEVRSLTGVGVEAAVDH